MHQERIGEERINDFKGSNRSYIEFLEDIAINHGYKRGPTVRATAPETPLRLTWQLQPGPQKNSSNSLQAVTSTKPQNEKEGVVAQCSAFLSGIRCASRWNESRRNSGLTTVKHNNWTVRFLVDDPCLLDEGEWRPFQFSPSPTTDIATDELSRAESYASRAANFRSDQKLITTVRQLLDLIYVQWCEVMEKRGRYSRDDIEERMYNRFGLKASASVSRYRYGADWTSNVSSKLIAEGWGNRAFELHAVRRWSMSQALMWMKVLTRLDSRPISTYARFSKFMRLTVSKAGEHLKKEEYLAAVENTPGWITICSPCILKFLIKDR